MPPPFNPNMERITAKEEGQVGEGDRTLNTQKLEEWQAAVT